MMNRRGLPYLVVGISVLLAAACTAERKTPVGSEEPRTEALPLLVRQSERADITLQTSLEGRLHFDANGCLTVGTDPSPFIIWPHGARIEEARDGGARIVDTVTRNAVSIGEEVVLKGGYRPRTLTAVTHPVPSACQADQYFIAGWIMSKADALDGTRKPR